ncbi:MAG: hypothetical protein M1823_002589 [Watsoniomyces obsoletus]|nr:MAG: hypothetical protein M1823_002589 [Watsoniomyces obsoletus]
MHRQSIPNLVYRHLYPQTRANDPNCFAMHLTRNLIPEVRAETSTFYGALDSVEARYPGLDYTHAPHRMRLGRFVHHRRLFRAFDELGLTDDEILGLCRWEGTRWARESYEKQEGVKVRDTTGDEIAAWVEPSRRAKSSMYAQQSSVQVQVERIQRGSGGMNECIEDEEVEEEEDEEEGDEEEEVEVDDDEEGEDDDGDVLIEADEDATVAHGEIEGARDSGEEEDDEDEEQLESVGIELNQRLNAAAEAREQGEEVVMDEAYEQWLKEATERGSLVGTTLATYSNMDPRIQSGFPGMAMGMGMGMGMSTTGNVNAHINTNMNMGHPSTRLGRNVNVGTSGGGGGGGATTASSRRRAI